MALLDVLTALKQAPNPAARNLDWAWRGLSEHIDRRYPLPDREHDDVRQRTLLKVFGAVDRMEADTPGRAEAWLRRVHRSARMDHHRTRNSALIDQALKTTPKDADPEWFERAMPSAEPFEDHTRDDDAALEGVISVVLDRVAQHLVDNVKSLPKRQGDYRRAEVALLASVRGEAYEGIVAKLGLDPPPSRGAVYKWIERGREQVLLPALEGWTHPAAASLVEHLTSTRRADAGKPRPARRSAVSRRGDASSKKGRRKK